MRYLYANFSVRIVKKEKGKTEIKISRRSNARILPSLNRLLRVLLQWHGDNSLVKMLELRSKNECEEQDQHADSVEMAEDKERKNWTRDRSDIQYSMLVSIWPGTVWVSDKGETIDIPVGSFIIWRGDCRHSGGAYATEHCRLFICIGSVRYPPSDYVAWEKEDNQSINDVPSVASDRYPLRNRQQPISYH